ncbi:hypothetical protein BGZ82_007293 [Podila clonocystis]|nr:hypothetical protein BGZ82_007293 [Podila clonocystis]
MENQSMPTTDASGSPPCPAPSPAESQARSRIQVSPSSSKATKPHWATGDPFFDTMAGMDESPEYRQYLSQISSSIASGTQEQAALESQIAGLSLDPSQEGEGASSSSTAASLANGSVAAANTGLEHWNRTREAWTKGRWHVVPSENSSNPALSALNNPVNHDAIYDSLVYDRKRLSKPIPLPLVIKILVSGWKRDGLWQESPAQTPPATYTPGFSSTNPRSSQRKL